MRKIEYSNTGLEVFLGGLLALSISGFGIYFESQTLIYLGLILVAIASIRLVLAKTLK